MTTAANPAGAARARRVGLWPGGALTVCRCLSWLHRFARTAPLFAALSGLAAAAAVVEALAGKAGPMTPATLIGVALMAAAIGAAGRVGGVVEQWLAVLGQAFDADPEPQLVAASDGRAVEANLAFERLFPAAGEAALDLAERAAAPAAAAFRSLRERATAGEPAIAAVALRLADGGPPRLFEVAAEPAAASSAYRLWRFRELGEHRSRQLRADETASADTRERAVAGSVPGIGWLRDRAQRFFADAPVGIAVVDRAGRFIDANPALGELFDAPPEHLSGRELIGWLSPDHRGGIAAMLADAADGHVDGTAVEIRLQPPGDRTMVMLLSRLDRPEEPRAPSADPGRGVTLYFIDVTERKQLETQFAQSQKMQAVGQLAGGVAHDFNNLLTAMIGFCDLLLLRSRPGDPAFADIMQIKQNASRAANLVRQLLAFSRQQSLQPRVLDVTDVLVELSHLLRRLIGENIELDFAHGRDLGLVKVDQGQLEQVVINLAVNARDAMPNGGRLTIRTENSQQPCAVRRGHELMPAGDYVLIEVADTGIGIAPGDLARIFEPFFSTKAVGSGTGLGLSTVYGIVKQTGGFVFVDSNPGCGASFAIYLPRHQGRGNVTTAPGDIAEPVAPRDLTGSGTIMLVEDDDAVRMFGARALRNKGYRVVEARSGEDALELIRTAVDPLDLLISDVVMPQMDGPSLIREVRSHDPGIKVIFMSGYTEDAFRQRLDSDCDIHFLSKPFTLKQLAAKVKDILGGEFRRPGFSDCVFEQNEYIYRPAARCTAASAVK